MIVRTIRVSNWRCLVDEIEVGPFDDGLNIIHAPNTTGKSTLFEAFVRGLLDGHKVTGREIEAIRPWGRDLAPKVTVEFAHGGQDYRISKQFLDGHRALLERRENGRYRKLAEGVSADEQTRQILSSHPPGRGLARPENWGIAQVLWAEQGRLTLERLSGDVVSDIRAMLSAQVSGAGTGPIEQRIEDKYLQFFSPKGKLKSGKDAPPLVRLQEQLEEAAQARQKAQEAYLAFEEASRRVEDLRARRVQAKRDADEITTTLKDARAAAEAYRKLTAERDRRSECVTAAESQYKELKQRIELIKSTTAELGRVRGEAAALESEIPLKQREIQDREKEAAKRKAELEDARKGREAVDAAAETARTALGFIETRKELRRLQETLTRIEQAEENLAGCRRKRNDHVAPEPRTLKNIRKAVKDRDEAQLRLEAALITLEIVPHNDGTVEVVGGEEPGSKPLKAGVPHKIQGSPEVIAELPGIARLRASGPAGSEREHRESRLSAEQKLKELTAPFGTSDPEALELLAEKAKELDAAVAGAETRLKTLLSDRTHDDLEQERVLLETKFRGFLEAFPEWEAQDPDAEALQSRAGDARLTFITGVEIAEEAWQKAHSALAAVSGQQEARSRRVQDVGKRVRDLEATLADHTADGKSPSERDEELRRITMAWDAAGEHLKDIHGKLAEFGDDPAAVVERLEAQLDGAGKASSLAREQEIREEARLVGLGTQGPYSALAAAEEKVAQLELEIRRENLRVEAIRLLRDTVAACRSEAIAAVSKPVEAAASRTLHRIAGRRLGDIQIGEGFEPAAVVPEIAGQDVGLDNLSGGEQEQLYLATRLALAEVLGRDERQLVVLDDVLTATDAGRLAKVMNVLEEAAQRLQILILTCHPERYRGLRTGNFFCLESLVRGAEGA